MEGLGGFGPGRAGLPATRAPLHTWLLRSPASSTWLLPYPLSAPAKLSPHTPPIPAGLLGSAGVRTSQAPGGGGRGGGGGSAAAQRHHTSSSTSCGVGVARSAPPSQGPPLLLPLLSFPKFEPNHHHPQSPGKRRRTRRMSGERPERGGWPFRGRRLERGVAAFGTNPHPLSRPGPPTQTPSPSPLLLPR